MFKIQLADRPFTYRGVLHEEYYQYFILLVDGVCSGTLRFDLSSVTLTEVLLDDEATYYDVFIRSALHHFDLKGYPRVKMEGDTFRAFLSRYVLRGVIEGNEVLLGPFFSAGCGGHA